jgi:hypothetical protein
MSARPWPPTLVHCRGSRVSSNLNILRRGGRFRQHVTSFPHGGDVQTHSFADKLKGLFSRFPDNCATWQIRHVRAKIVFALFEDYNVSHPIRHGSKGGSFTAGLQSPSRRAFNF